MTAAASASVVVVHGPARVAAAECGPYHGILPRGLERVGIDPAAWPTLAPQLDHALGAARPPAATAGALDALLTAAKAEGVLAYAASAELATRFVRRLASDSDRLRAIAVAAGAPDPVGADPERIELWSVREGHTSSVWRAELNAPAWQRPIVLALDVARSSGAAAAELNAVGAELERMHASDASRVNRVLALDHVEVADEPGAARVPVVASTWLEGARELHVGPDARWIAVEHFEPRADGAQDPNGARKGEAESDACWAELVDLTVSHSYMQGDAVHSARFEPNDGDLVEHEGRIRVVAASPPSGPLPLGQWVASCLLPSASGARGRVVWPSNQRALDVFAAAAERNPRLPAAVDCIEAAITFVEPGARIVR